MSANINYKQLGLKAGLEFHQRLDTKTKLFCNCLTDQPDAVQPYETIERLLRPVAGELGKTDPAALKEFLKGSKFKYNIFHDTCCLVELDEDPPHALNPEALETALMISLMLKADVIDEVHVMRKTVIDGSNVSGFQRTALIAHSGELSTKIGNIPITSIYVEEEAAAISEGKESKTFNLNRLGIPLVEIVTGTFEATPLEIKDVALTLGTLLRTTGKVKRGIGTIRQDVNLSIKEGARVEVKGLQEIRILDKVIEKEVERQLSLIKLKQEIQRRKLKKFEVNRIDFTIVFKDTECEFLRNKNIFGTILTGFKGLLGFELTEGRRFGSELADHARQFGLGGLIHSDEDPAKYKINKEFAEIRKQYKLKEDDAFILFASEKTTAGHVLGEIINRVNAAFDCVPKETRNVLPDANTRFLRVLAGSSRMYPETDVPPILVDEKLVSEIKKVIPKEPDKILSELITRYQLNQDLAERMVTSRHLKLFYDLCKIYNDSTFIASTLLNTLIALRREGIPIENLTDDNYKEIFSSLSKGKLPKSEVREAIKALSMQPTKKLQSVKTVSASEINARINELIKKNSHLLDDKRKAFKGLMGDLMKEFKSNADAGLIAELLKKKLE